MVALATTSIAWVILTIIIVGWILYYILNNRSARPELGSEVELAPNRKAYYPGAGQRQVREARAKVNVSSYPSPWKGNRTNSSTDFRLILMSKSSTA